jgi:prepilin-type N-terminal cleavage/methylation domain-containing protein
MRPARFTLIELLVVLAIIAILIALLEESIFEFGFALLAGWVTFPIRVVPQIRADLWSVGTFVVCLVGLVVGSQLFLGRLSREVQQARGVGSVRPWPLSWTLTLVALVVMMFVAGVSAVGVGHQVGWLVSSPEPWVERSPGGRQVGYRVASSNNLRTIGIALHGYADTTGAMPPGGTFDAHGSGLHGWQTLLLPYVEHEHLFKQVNLDKPWHHPDNAAPLATAVPYYLNPVITVSKGSPYAPSHYAGNARLLGAKGFKLDEIKDGASNTLLGGEVNARFKPWGHPTNWRDPALGINRSPDGFGSPWKGGAYLLMADGSIRFVTDAAAPDVLRAASTPDGGEPATELPGP